jgi:hypothetical protein
MSVIRNEHGVFHVRKKVPKRLEEAAATVMGRSKDRIAWLQRSLKRKMCERRNVWLRPSSWSSHYAHVPITNPKQ